MDKIAVIIVNWNTGKLLTECLESLIKLPEKHLISRVIVVDNGSSDASLTDAQEAVGDNKLPISYISLRENVGFAEGNNTAIKDLKTDGPFDDHILLLNPDTEVKPGALKAMADVLERHQNAGIIGPKLLNADGSHQPSVRHFPTLGIFVLQFLKIHRLLPQLAVWRTYLAEDFDYKKETAVDQVMGAAFLIRDRVITDVGVLDPSFWVWFEEVDYCKRAYAAGWEVWYTPEAEVVHHGGVSFNQLVGFKKAWPWISSSLNYAFKHLGFGTGLTLSLLTPVALVLTIPSMIWHLVARKTNSKKL